MPQPIGNAVGEDPTVLVPLKNWEPRSDRKWALAYIREDRSEDYEGFRQEFSKRHPHLFSSGIDAYYPPSVDYYVRREPNGKRLDLDFELMNLPKTEETRKREEAVRNELMEKRREQLLRAREKEAEIASPDNGYEPPPSALCGWDLNPQRISQHQARCERCQEILENQKLAAENSQE